MVSLRRQMEEERRARRRPAKRAKTGGGCEHPVSCCGKCLACRGIVRDGHGTAFGYLLPTLRITEAHAGIIRRTNTERAVRAGKLHLVLDLDNTLLHTVKVGDGAKVGRVEVMTGCGTDMFLIDKAQLTKLRPFVREFLREASEMFEMTVYTMGAREYGGIMAGLIDPEGSYFSDRVIGREDCTRKGKKSLDVVLAEETNVVIVDDRSDVWPEHGANLMRIEPYRYLTAVGRAAEDGAEEEEEEEDDDDDMALLEILERLRSVHWAYFSSESDAAGIKDVRALLKLV